MSEPSTYRHSGERALTGGGGGCPRSPLTFLSFWPTPLTSSGLVLTLRAQPLGTFFPLLPHPAPWHPHNKLLLTPGWGWGVGQGLRPDSPVVWPCLSAPSCSPPVPHHVNGSYTQPLCPCLPCRSCVDPRGTRCAQASELQLTAVGQATSHLLAWLTQALGAAHVPPEVGTFRADGQCLSRLHPHPLPTGIGNLSGKSRVWRLETSFSLWPFLPALWLRAGLVTSPAHSCVS